jgi:nitrite reductase/ring-hydroxylating ferredoxin subunit/uncharacterized membrane protein
VDLSRIAERLEDQPALDRLVDPLETLAGLVPPGEVKDLLHGVWLGHPLHPLLTDLPIGFWTSAFVLDLVGGRKGQPAADALVALGVVSALPTAAAGLADWSELSRPDQRSGAVHAAANLTATALYAWSFVARRRGRRLRGVALGMAGSAAATVGGFLGGHLTFRRSAGVNQVAFVDRPAAWTPVDSGAEPDVGTLGEGRLGDTTVATTRAPSGEVLAVADRCSHLGGPLHEGTLDGGCVRCPWHGSTFRMTDGSVVHGPATAPQPAYEVRETAGGLEARSRRP